MTKAGLPIGLQLQGRPFDEERLLQAAQMYQTATDWHTKAPQMAK
jgi:aspartyl-tRNA(Asn)/glutamyl-tRNA(Gln) amidotransferase subunit A